MDEEQFKLIERLVADPQESLAIEIKSWINLSEPKGIAKLVKNILAIRNHNGGYIVLGFTDPDLHQQPAPKGVDVRKAFHIDEVQPLVVRFASEHFEVATRFVERDGMEHPVIIVPSGVKTPVAAKSDLQESGRHLIRSGDVFVRSLNANNKPSTAKAGWKDWRTITDICFDNREADIGRFIRRHLSGVPGDELRTVLHQLIGSEPSEVEDGDVPFELLELGRLRFANLISDRSLTLPGFGTWEVSAVVNGELPDRRADSNFLNLLSSANPRLTGWPIWRDSRASSDETARPFVFEKAWEALMISIDSGWDHIDFMRLDPKGQFYLLRALQDDISPSERAPKAGTKLDFGLQVLRTTEAVAVGMAYAKAMGLDEDHGEVHFGFRWNGLSGRELSSWANFERYVSPGRIAVQDQVTSDITVPANAPQSAFFQYVSSALGPLFELFDGFVLSDSVYEDMSARLLERRL